jgi:hypothetical protein
MQRHSQSASACIADNASAIAAATHEQVAKAEAAFQRMRARTKNLGIALSDEDVVSLV